VILIRVLALRYTTLRLRGEFSFVDDGFGVFKSTAIGSLLVVAAAFLYRGGFDYRTFSYARAVFLVDFLIALALFLCISDFWCAAPRRSSDDAVSISFRRW